MNSFNPSLFSEKANLASHLFQTPSISAAVIYNDEIIFEDGFGTIAADSDQKSNENTSYAIASMTKSMTAACLSMLAEQNIFHWEDPVRKFLPYFDLYDTFAAREMQVRDLLIHNSGLKEVSGGTLWYGSDLSREEVIRRLRFIHPASSFRSTYAYQNVCYLAAGLVLEAVSGERWEDFLTDHLFTPLAMNRTMPTLSRLKASNMGNIATPYFMLNGKLTATPYRSHDNCGPAASVHSTAHDLANYLRLFLNNGSFEGRQILKPETVREIRKPRVVDGISVKRAHPRLEQRFPCYGYGWRIRDYGGKLEISHTGGVDGNRCYMAYFPEEKFGAVVLTDSEDRRAYLSLMLTIFDMMTGLEPVDWLSVLENEPNDCSSKTLPEQIKGTVPSLSMDDCAGAYRDAAYGDILVENCKNKLVLSFTRTSAFTADLIHYHYNTWQLCWRDPYIPHGLVTFIPGCDGLAAFIHFDQPNLLDVDFSELEMNIPKVCVRSN